MKVRTTLDSLELPPGKGKRRLRDTTSSEVNSPGRDDLRPTLVCTITPVPWIPAPIVQSSDETGTFHPVPSFLFHGKQRNVHPTSSLPSHVSRLSAHVPRVHVTLPVRLPGGDPRVHRFPNPNPLPSLFLRGQRRTVPLKMFEGRYPSSG